MSTLRINNIEAKSVPASPTIDEKVKITNSSGDVLIHIDGKTSGITTIGINTTAGNIKFDANSNVVVTGIITATKFVGEIEPTNLTVSGKVSVGGSVTAATFYGDGSNLTGISGVSVANQADNRLITATGTTDALNGEAGLTYDGSALIVRGSDAVTGSGGTKTISLRGGDANNEFVNLSFDTGAGGPLAVISAKADATGVYPNTSGSLTFNTQVAGGVFERLRITSDGRIGMHDSSPNDYELDIMKRSTATDANLRLYNNATGSSNDTILRLHIAGTSASNYIYFGDGDDSNVGQIRYQHSNDSMQFFAGGTERFRITSEGDWKAASFDNTYACMYRSLSNSQSSNMMNSAGDMIFASATYSMGNSNVYNTSNGRYTAPIRGLYLFNFNGLLDNSYTSGSIYVKARIDGSLTDIFYIYESAQNGYYHHVSGSHVIALNAGQYHQFYASNAGFHISNETQFSACLIQAY